MNLENVGIALRHHRLVQNLSIKDLSQKSGVAGSTISQIETGKTSPNLVTLKSICDALDVPVFSLFLEDSSDKIQIVRASQQSSFIRNTSNGKALKESLIIQGKNEMYAAIVEVPPHTDSGNYSHHGGEEFVYVLEGSLVFDMESNGTYALYQHDTIYYPNYIGHRWENHSDETARILMVSTAPYMF